ncbi:ubiquitin-domain protein [Fusarium sp. NRRL 52700]|nr:ubiquitin-domain protein [Fusarium sp. NRRL 52700]
MYLDFQSDKQYAIRISTGDVNVISGEPPWQPWVFGVSTEPGEARQFVATPGERDTACLQFEVTRLDSLGDDGRTINIWIEETDDIPIDQQVLIFNGKKLMGVLVFVCVTVRVLIVKPRLRLIPRLETLKWAFALGGVVRQEIADFPKQHFRKTVTIAFNVHVLNGAGFTAVTGRDPPPTPIAAEVYAGLGVPFYHLYQEHRFVHGSQD